MKSILVIFVSLAIAGCLAYIEVKPLGTVERCPYTNETFHQRVTLDGLEDYLTENKMATLACIKEVEEDYERALEVFVTNMTEVTDKFKAKSSNDDELKKNYPYFVSKALQDMGKEIQEYVKLMKAASGKGKSENVKHYDKTLKQIVEEGYKLYEKNLGYLETKEPSEQKKTDVKNIIHVGCSPGMRMLEEVEKEFKKCIQERLSQSEVQDES